MIDTGMPVAVVSEEEERSLLTLSLLRIHAVRKSQGIDLSNVPDRYFTNLYFERWKFGYPSRGVTTNPDRQLISFCTYEIWIIC